MAKQAVFGNAKKCIPHIERVLKFLKDEFYISDAEDNNEEEEEPVVSTLFPSHKYLDLTDKTEIPNIKSKYKELSLLYHPDKCPNSNTPNMTKKDCEEEFKIINNEYNIIKNHFGIAGGKRRTKKRNPKKKLSKRRKSNRRRKYKK